MAIPLTAVQANAVYDILVKHAGSAEEAREGFVYLQSNGHLPEYRFIGGLGFGGKFRRNGWKDRWYVDCYEEDLTPERQAMIEAANKALAELKEKA